MLVEEYLRVGISLLDATEQTANLRAGGASVDPEVSSDPAVQSEAALARENEKALQELQAMMGGIG